MENDKGHPAAGSLIYRSSNFPKEFYWLKLNFALGPDDMRNTWREINESVSGAFFEDVAKYENKIMIGFDSNLGELMSI